MPKMTDKQKKSFLQQWNNIVKKSMQTIILDEDGLENALCYMREDFRLKIKNKSGEVVKEQVVQKLIFSQDDLAYSILTSSKGLIEQFDFLKNFKALVDVLKIKKNKRSYWQLKLTGEFDET